MWIKDLLIRCAAINEIDVYIHRIKYARIWFFTDYGFSSTILPLHWRIQVNENPYSSIFYAVIDIIIKRIP